jgi:hypothetical protein
MLWKQKVRIECIGLHILQVTLATRQYVYNRCLKTAIKLPLQCYNIMQCVVWSNYIHLLVHLFNGIYIHYISPEMNTHANTRRVSDFSCLTISFHHWPHALLYWASKKNVLGQIEGLFGFLYIVLTRFVRLWHRLLHRPRLLCVRAHSLLFIVGVCRFGPWAMNLYHSTAIIMQSCSKPFTSGNAQWDSVMTIYLGYNGRTLLPSSG